MSAYDQPQPRHAAQPHTWLIAAVAGYIGGNLLEALLKLNQCVVGLDNIAAGHQRNLDEVQTLVSPEQWANINFIEVDIREPGDCQPACRGVDFALHQAALSSMPRSLEDPVITNSANITGFPNMLLSAHDANGKGIAHTASSSTSGNHPALSKVEAVIGKCHSRIAVTRDGNELYVETVVRSFGFNAIDPRYFNLCDPRQDTNGACAAVTPKLTAAMIHGKDVIINGDGETSPDYCFVANVVQTNLLAAATDDIKEKNNVDNVALADRATLNALRIALNADHHHNGVIHAEVPKYRAFGADDMRHNQAEISKAVALLG